MNLELINKLKEYPVADRNLITKLFGYDKKYSSLVLQRLEKRRILTKISKGKYTAIDNIYKIATHIYFPSYISLLTASMLKNATEQIINTVQVMSNYNKTIKLKGYTIEFLRINKKYLFGYRNENNIFIADNEKLLLDMLLYRSSSGNFQEIVKVVENLEFNIKTLTSYLNKINKKSLIKRTGFLLEKHKKIDLSNKFKLDNNYVRLNIFKKSKKYNSKWRIKYD